jgi:hypothetical protein
MRFGNHGLSLWFAAPDTPAPGDVVYAGEELSVTVAVQPGNRYNKVEVLFSVNKGPDESVAATWVRNDVRANVQYFRACLPARAAGDLVDYIPVCYRAGRMVPSEEDIQRARSSFHVTETGLESRGRTLQDAAGSATVAHVVPAPPPTGAIAPGKGISGAGEQGLGKSPLDPAGTSGAGRLLPDRRIGILPSAATSAEAPTVTAPRNEPVGSAHRARVLQSPPTADVGASIRPPVFGQPLSTGVSDAAPVAAATIAAPPAAPTPPSPSIRDIAGAAKLDISPELEKSLAGLGIRTLSDLQSAGPLKTRPGLPVGGENLLLSVLDS